MTPGTKIRTTYEHSETGTIVKPRRGEGVPTPDWFVVRFDRDGGRLRIHRSMLVLSNG